MSSLKDLNYQVQIPYAEGNAECPFCREVVRPMVTVKVTDGTVRHVGTQGKQKNFSVDLEAEVVINHTCERKPT